MNHEHFILSLPRGYEFLRICLFSVYNIFKYNLIFFCRCGAQQSGDLGSSNEALDGILGFGQANSSMLSQLASSGKARKEFAHCLDTEKGGGIFAIGHVVEPKVPTTPLVPDQYVPLSLTSALNKFPLFSCFM